MTYAAALIREMSAFQAARRGGLREDAWRALGRIHVLTQQRAWPHLRTHLIMLSYALETRAWSEVRGQLARLVLAPIGNLSGRLPLGNTGLSDVSAFAAMPVPEDLRRAVAVGVSCELEE